MSDDVTADDRIQWETHIHEEADGSGVGAPYIHGFIVFDEMAVGAFAISVDEYDSFVSHLLLSIMRGAYEELDTVRRKAVLAPTVEFLKTVQDSGGVKVG